MERKGGNGVNTAPLRAAGKDFFDVGGLIPASNDDEATGDIKSNSTDITTVTIP